MKKERNMERVSLNCAVCNEPFTVTESRFLNKNPKFCSRPCQWQASRKKEEKPKRAYNRKAVNEVPESKVEWRKPLPLFGPPK